MRLTEMKFSRFKGQANEWRIEGRPVNEQYEQWLSFEQLTLIVGKNASGKSKTLDAVRHIADLFCGDVQLSRLRDMGLGTAEYQLRFDDEGHTFEYDLNFENGKILQEVLTVNGQEKLNRKAGKLWYEGAKSLLDFETDAEILAVSKRDKKQHSFFETLAAWGKTLNHYKFGTPLGRTRLLHIQSFKDEDDVDLKDGDHVTEVFLKGKNQFKQSFLDAIIDDMRAISYDIKKIEAGPIKNFDVPFIGLHVQENGLGDMTYQTDMSQGMFRALSLIVQLNYALLGNVPSCILIDDIGEGLDYDRSKSLIDLIITKVKGSTVQVIMTTNDRFVMNKVPLEYWSVIQRVAKKSLFYNYKNSKETFDEYAYSGLSNFDFLATEFYISGFEKEEV
jgi:energy-coupling factor transporter ATP-binding protein EcfA2